MSQTIKAVLFDLDGTLLDTADDLGAALNYVLTKHNIAPVPAQQYRPVASDGAKGLLTLGLKEKLADFNFEQLRDEFLTYYENNIAKYTKLYPGIAELIKCLDEHNMPWGIVTNKPEGLTNKLLPFFSEFKHCKVIVGGDSLANRKPHPEPLNFSLDKITTKAEHCYYVGDAPRDIEAGIAANMPTIIAGWGYISNINACKSWQADHICMTPNDIIQLLTSASSS